MNMARRRVKRSRLRCRVKQVYDYELLERVASDMGLRTSLLESVDERRQSWLLESTAAFMSAPTKGDWGPLVTQSEFVHHLVKVMLALSLHGECVIVGRGAALVLPAETTLRVRLVAPVRWRVEMLRRNLGLSEHDAARQLRTIDRARTDFARDHFLKDPAATTNYDLILNALHLSVGQRAELIVETLERLRDHSLEQQSFAAPP
jgi:Cytidylate kinase-like family